MQDRLTELEIKFMQQEQTLEALSEQVYLQQKEITLLNRQIHVLQDRLKIHVYLPHRLSGRRNSPAPLLMSAASSRYQLVQTPTRLELHDTADHKTGAVYVDFAEGKARHRLNFGGGKGQDIAKAIGLHKFKHPEVLDTTAGLGNEAFVLASLGCTVTLLERSPVMHALLADGLQRAKHSDDPHLRAICERMTLVHIDARDWLLNKADSDRHGATIADVIYLDPMFPERNKSALVQKEMRFIHALVGDEQDADADAELLELARRHAKHRVVVKRPRLAPLLSTTQPAFVISGKAVRYDVYLPSSTPMAAVITAR